MVRTRGLHRALGRRQRPTTFARRQQAIVAIAEDVEHVEHPANEVHEQPQELVTDDERSELKLFSHGRKVQKFGRPALEIEGIVHKKTSSFHLSVGEVTITLDDVASLLHLPITDAFHNFDALDIDQVVELLVELLEVSCTLIANKSVAHMHVIFLEAFCDLNQFGSYSWGATALVHMYDNFNDAPKRTARQHAGYIILVGSMSIFLLFLRVLLMRIIMKGNHVCRWKYEKALLVSTYRKRMDRLMSDVVCWIPYGDHCSFKEFELISLFSGQIRWGPFIICVVPKQCATDYIELFYMISHPFMSPKQPEDPLRHPPVVHDETFILPNPPQQPIDAATMPKPHAPTPALANVGMPQHAISRRRWHTQE
ncbi:Protein MAINTENANCE OF MERISTEMS [Glycine soja]